MVTSKRFADLRSYRCYLYERRHHQTRKEYIHDEITQRHASGHYGPASPDYHENPYDTDHKRRKR